MAKWVLSASLVIWLPVAVGAQSLAPSPVTSNPPAGGFALSAGVVGALLGGGVGVAFGVAAAQAECSSRCGAWNDVERPMFFGIGGAVIGGLIGTAIGRSHRGANHPSRLAGIEVSPILAPDARGGRLAFKF
jgi:uncharacterized membrane protein YeaQ/YmgE (transglycosylase-associated protein family)